VAFEKRNGQKIEAFCGKLGAPLIEQRVIFSLIGLDGVRHCRKFGRRDAEQIVDIRPFHGVFVWASVRL